MSSERPTRLPRPSRARDVDLVTRQQKPATPTTSSGTVMARLLAATTAATNALPRFDKLGAVRIWPVMMAVLVTLP